MSLYTANSDVSPSETGAFYFQFKFINLNKMRHLTKTLFIFSIFYISAQNPTLASIKSYIDNYSNGQIQGWVLDTSETSTSLNIEIFRDGPNGIGTYLGPSNANNDSSDVNQYFGISGNHRFNWTITAPPDPRPHLYYLYALALDGNLLPISSGPIVYPAFSATTYRSPQVVFDSATEQCDTDDFPDHPARAFRTADGKTHLIASWINVRQFVGPGLNGLTHKCAIMYKSKKDKQFDQFSYYQWLQTPYTLDGTTVFNVTHNEWYGNIVKPECKGDLVDGWVSALTLTVSNDMAKSFNQPMNYKIRYPSTYWSNMFPCDQKHPTRYGDLGGSNIISYKETFYKFFYYEPEPSIQPPTGWQCVMRTKALGNPNAYEVLTDTGWISDHSIPCKQIFGNLCFRSVTYNTFLGMFLAVFQNGTDFYLTGSKDLMNWSLETKIKLPKIDTTKWLYPSLLDPQDKSLNYENTSQGFFLYCTYYNGNDISRKLMRIRLWLTISG